jgi:hypothetical protein
MRTVIGAVIFIKGVIMNKRVLLIVGLLSLLGVSFAQSGTGFYKKRALGKNVTLEQQAALDAYKEQMNEIRREKGLAEGQDLLPSEEMRALDLLNPEQRRTVEGLIRAGKVWPHYGKGYRGKRLHPRAAGQGAELYKGQKGRYFQGRPYRQSKRYRVQE